MSNLGTVMIALSAVMAYLVISGVSAAFHETYTEFDGWDTGFAGALWPFYWVYTAVSLVYSYALRKMSKPRLPKARVISRERDD